MYAAVRQANRYARKILAARRIRHSAGGRNYRLTGVVCRTVGHCQSFGNSLFIQAGLASEARATGRRLLAARGECAKVSNALSSTDRYTVREVRMFIARFAEEDAVGKITLSILAVKPGGYILKGDFCPPLPKVKRIPTASRWFCGMASVDSWAERLTARLKSKASLISSA